MKIKYLVPFIFTSIFSVSGQEQLRRRAEEFESTEVTVTKVQHCEVRKDPISDEITNPKNLAINPPRQVEPFCVDFNKDDETFTEGFAKCPGYYDNVDVSHSITNPYSDGMYGQGGPGDYYLHLRDTSGASLACGSSGPYIGDWSSLVCEDDSCYNFCFDMIIHHDGCTSWNPACDQSNNGTSYVNIKPRIIIQGGAPTFYRVVFAADIDITDPDGINPGWHRVCAPLRPLDAGGSLPSNSEGEWLMGSAPCDSLGGTNCAGTITGVPPNTAWCDLFKDVTAINLLIDPTPNPAERFGYDNICIEKRDDCNPPPCEPEPLCYWQHEFDCKEVKKLEKWEEVLQLSGYFDEKTCVCKIMNQCCPDRCDMADQEYMALLMNIASGKLDLECCVIDCGEETTVKEILERIEELLIGNPCNDGHCTEALSLATGINYGTDLCNSTTPSMSPTPQQTELPTPQPTREPTSKPTDKTQEPTWKPSQETPKPTPQPNYHETPKPTKPTSQETPKPTPQPNYHETPKPTKPTSQETPKPTPQPIGEQTPKPVQVEPIF